MEELEEDGKDDGEDNPRKAAFSMVDEPAQEAGQSYDDTAGKSSESPF
jgi:hypothetical protein